MKQEERKPYIAPTIEVIRMENEGSVMSGSLPGVIDGGNAYGNAGTYRSTPRNYNSAGSSELEDMINDILTVEQ